PPPSSNSPSFPRQLLGQLFFLLTRPSLPPSQTSTPPVKLRQRRLGRLFPFAFFFLSFSSLLPHHLQPFSFLRLYKHRVSLEDCQKNLEPAEHKLSSNQLSHVCPLFASSYG